jgi:hypothetical protein
MEADSDVCVCAYALFRRKQHNPDEICLLEYFDTLSSLLVVTLWMRL